MDPAGFYPAFRLRSSSHTYTGHATGSISLLEEGSEHPSP